MSITLASLFPPASPEVTACLWGTAMGDASGFLVEKRSPAHCKSYALKEWHPWWSSGIKPDLTRHGYSFGQTSDDTVFSLLLCRQLLSGWNLLEFWNTVSDFEREHGIVGMGNGTRQALERFRTGIPAPLAGAPAPMASNGGIMRVPVVGAWASSWEEAAQVAIEQSLPSHRDPKCLDMAAVIAVFGYFLKTHNPSAAWSATISVTSRVLSQETLDAIALLPGSEATVEYTLDVLLKLTPSYAQRDWKGISPYVLATGLWSVWCMLKEPDDFEGLMFCVLSGGGDADTTCAIASGLFGIRHTDFYPTEYCDQLCL